MTFDSEPQQPVLSVPIDPMRRGGIPVAFDGCAGFLHPAAGNVGVLMLSPWGFEEFTVRQGWRLLAETLAGNGFSCLRFDLPGTGDSLTHNSDITALDTWLSSTNSASEVLRKRTGISHLVVLGQGLGAILAVEMLDKIRADSLIAMAPLPPGRAGMRELELWGAVVASALRIPVELGENDALNIAGFRLSKPLFDEMKRLKTSDAPFVSVRSGLVLARSERPSDMDFAEALAARGMAVTRQNFEGYDAFVAHLETPRAPELAFADICNGLRQNYPDRGDARSSLSGPERAILSSPMGKYSEEALCFGPANRLFGVLCAPPGEPRATVIIPNSGYNPHVGWARGHVNLARRLAGVGIASFRMDCASLGDSDAVPDSVRDVLYSDAQIADVEAAIDMLCAYSAAPIVVAGRCSGAYIANNVAQRDERVSGVISINALRLIWNPDETLEQAMAGGSGSLSSYKARAFSRDTLIRLFKFQLPVVDLTRKVAGKVLDKAASKLVGVTGGLTLAGRLRGAVRARFTAFEARGVEVALVYAIGDGGLDELEKYCGNQGKWLSRFSNVTVRLVENADHNMTADHAQDAIFQAIETLIQRVEALNRNSKPTR